MSAAPPISLEDVISRFFFVKWKILRDYEMESNETFTVWCNL